MQGISHIEVLRCCLCAVLGAMQWNKWPVDTSFRIVMRVTVCIPQFNNTIGCHNSNTKEIPTGNRNTLHNRGNTKSMLIHKRRPLPNEPVNVQEGILKGQMDNIIQ